MLFISTAFVLIRGKSIAYWLYSNEMVDRYFAATGTSVIRCRRRSRQRLEESLRVVNWKSKGEIEYHQPSHNAAEQSVIITWIQYHSRIMFRFLYFCVYRLHEPSICKCMRVSKAKKESCADAFSYIQHNTIVWNGNLKGFINQYSSIC